MNQTTTLSYYAGPEFQLVRLGYRGGRFAMYVLLPKQGTGLELESALPRAFATARANATQRRVNLRLPKLHLSYEADLISPLRDAGLGIAFSDRADFWRNQRSTAANQQRHSQDRNVLTLTSGNDRHCRDGSP